MKRALPYLLFALLTLAVFWKVLFYGHTVLGIAILETHQGRPQQPPPAWFRGSEPHWRVYDHIMLFPLLYGIYNDGLKEGELRLWNPNLACGYPLYANPMVHPFYPPHLLLHAAFPPLLAYDLNLMLHFFFSGVAMFWALRALGRGAAGAAAGGVVWMLLGYHAIWFSSSILPGVSVFGPLALKWIVEGLERRDLTRAGLASAAMGMAVLGSHPQHALNIFFLLLALMIALSMRKPQESRFGVRFCTVFCALTVGVALAAILTRLDSIAYGYRPVESGFDNVYKEPLLLLTYLLGPLFGKVYYSHRMVIENEFTIYAGAAAVTLALVASIRLFRDPVVRFAALFAAATLLVSFVKPFAAGLQVIPILNLSPPSRWLFVFGFCLSLLAGYGLESVLRAPKKVFWGLIVVSTAFIVVCLVGAGPFHYSNLATLDTLIGFALAAAAVFAAIFWRPLGLCLFFTALIYELLPFFLHFNFAVDGKILQETPAAVRFVQEREKGEPWPWRGTGSARAAIATSQRDPQRNPQKALWDELCLGNNVLGMYGVENVAGYDAIFPTRYQKFSNAAGGKTTGRVLVIGDFRSPLLDVAGLKYVFWPFPSAMVSPRFRQVGTAGPVRIYENTKVLPRARVVGNAVTVPSQEEALRVLQSPSFDPRRTTVLEMPTPPSLDSGPLESEIRRIHRSSDRTALEVDVSRGALLVLTETNYPGWEATVDGQAAPIHRADGTFRAVGVPTGTHTVEFRFRPVSARWGLPGSLAFLILALGFGLSGYTGRRSS